MIALSGIVFFIAICCFTALSLKVIACEKSVKVQFKNYRSFREEKMNLCAMENVHGLCDRQNMIFC